MIFYQHTYIRYDMCPAVVFRIWQETPKEGPRTRQTKRCEYNNKDDKNSPNTLNNKNWSSLFKVHFMKPIYSNIW